ncbi:MAG: NADH-quinone oxidoreductase subunit L [Acidimicrobiales bacterium]
MLTYAWVIPLLPAVSFVLILFFGKRMPRRGSELGVAAVGAAFVLSLLAGYQWIERVNQAEDEPEHALAAAGSLQGEEGEADEAAEEHHPAEPVLTETTWFTIGGRDVKVGTFVDGLSVMMLFVVTLVSLLVHIYSTDYVRGDRRYTHFFAFLSLFTASMLLLVISRNMIQFITAWELVGVCSFVLIGHWWEEKANSDAALKAFLTNRVGDVGLMIGVIVLFFAADSFDIVEINDLANAGELSHGLLLIASCSLLAAVMSKSGQFILHTWLPDAMAGPTPVSALIHAATMVCAGIFMVARMYSVFWEGLSIGAGGLNALALVGAVTVLGGAMLAFVQNDIKRVLAYSTVSQLGYMVMALGVGAWTAALFHLFTHAFFKAGLFLGSGSVSHSVHSFDMKADMGGLRRYMPRTFATFVICTGALIGIFPLAGFWSKDEILAGAGQNGYPAMLAIGIVGAFMTAAYMTRCLYLTFWGEPRGAAKEHEHHLHESGPVIVVPLMILAGLAIVAGFANLPTSGALSWVPERVALLFEHYVQPTGAAYFPPVAELEFQVSVALIATPVALLGIGLAYLYWFRDLLQGLSERSRVAMTGYALLENKFYFDALYSGVIAEGVKGPIARAAYWVDRNLIDAVLNGTAAAAKTVGDFMYGTVDQGVVDGAVNGSGAISATTGRVLRRLQTGKVQQYGALLFGGAIVLAGIVIFAL